MTKSLVEIAEEIATEAHKRQHRKDGITPYIEHPKAVVGLLKGIGVTDEKILSAAWLHDVLEDTEFPAYFMEKELGKDITNIVKALTRDCSREEYKEKLEKAGYEVKIIKLADYVHNCQTLFLGLYKKTIMHKVEDAKFYLDMAKEIAPGFCDRIAEALNPFR